MLLPNTHKKVTYGGIPTLRDALCEHFGQDLDLPIIQEDDLRLLDDAISLLTPSEAQVRVVEVDTFTESERSIARGNIPLDDKNSNYALRQKTIILKRAAPSDASPEQPVASEKTKIMTEKIPPSATTGNPAAFGADPKIGEPTKDAAAGDSDIAELHLVAAAQTPPPASTESAREAGYGSGCRDIPEIILFWARNRRSGGNLVVCPENSMDQLIEAYLVCEVVEHSESVRKGLLATHEGALMGVELGEGSPAEQGALDSLISDYSFHDASVGVVSLAASIYYFGVMGRNDVNVLTLLAVAVVAGLNQEATWPWVFKLILQCSSIKDPMIRVALCRQVHHHHGQLSGQGVLAIGLAVFGVYLEVVPTNDGETPLLFRILLNVFQGLMLAVLVANMVQAVEPMAVSNQRPRDRLRKWAKVYLEGKVYDTVWYLTLIVALVWAGVIAVVVSQLPYEGERRGWSVLIACLVVMALSLCTVNPGMALLGLWGLVWLIPVGLSFVFRSAFDLLTLLINRVRVTARRMAREATAHVRTSSQGAFSVRDLLILLLQVLPLTPLMLVFVLIPFLWFLAWVVHVSLRGFLLVADMFVYPISPFRMYPLLSEYGAVSWKMGRLTMEVELSSMRTLLKRRVGMLLKESRLMERFETGVLPCKPYVQLNHTSVPRLGCIAVEVDPQDGHRELLTGKQGLDRRLRARTEGGEDPDDYSNHDAGRDQRQHVAPSQDGEV